MTSSWSHLCNLTCSTPVGYHTKPRPGSLPSQPGCRALLSNIVYGVELALFGICFKLLVQQTNRENYRRQLFFLSFITLVFILGTVFVYSNSEFTQLAFVDDRDFPGGPAMFEDKMFWIPVDELGVVSWVVGNWMMDMLMAPVYSSS